MFLGYIGGTAHAYLAKAHPDWEFTLFVRSEERAKPIKEAYPNTKFVYGSLDDAAIIEKAAAEADIVVRTSSPYRHFRGQRLYCYLHDSYLMQTRQTLQTRLLLQLPSPRGSQRGTRPKSQATGFIHRGHPS